MVDSLALGGSDNAYTGSSGIGKKTLFAVYLFAHLSLARQNGEEMNT